MRQWDSYNKKNEVRNHPESDSNEPTKKPYPAL